MQKLGWSCFGVLALSLGVAATSACAQTCVFTAEQYGAKGDGKTLNTAAIQKAIDTAAASKCHGSKVQIGIPGVYLTGSIFVKSGVDLVVDKGVTLQGSQNLKDYPLRQTRVAGIEMAWPSALVNIYEQQHAGITGEGTIDGNGKVFWDHYWARRAEYDTKGLRWAADYDDQRPRLIQVYNSGDVKVGGGLLLKRPGFWTVHICYSHDVVVDGLTIRANDETVHDGGRNGHGPSTDGVDIDSSRKVEVAHVDIENNDDAICLKSGRDADGLRVDRPTEDVIIHDSIIRVGAAGVTFGSETSGGFRNIEVYGIHTLDHVPSGILFKSAHTRGGFGENIRIHDMTLENTPAVLRMTMDWNPSYSYAKIPDGMTDVPPYYKVLATPVPESKGIAHFHDVHIWNIKATGAKIAFDVNGYPSVPLDHFTLDHLNIQAATAGHISNAKDWTFNNVTLNIADGTSVSTADSTGMWGLPGSSKPSDRKKQAPHGHEE